MSTVLLARAELATEILDFGRKFQSAVQGRDQSTALDVVYEPWDVAGRDHVQENVFETASRNDSHAGGR